MGQELLDLDLVHKIESDEGKDPNSWRPNAAGALGPYQLRPIAWKDLQRVKPEVYGDVPFAKGAVDPVMARQAARDYLILNMEYLKNYGLPVNVDYVLASYNTGIGSVQDAWNKTGKLSSAADRYVTKYRTAEQQRRRARTVEKAALPPVP